MYNNIERDRNSVATQLIRQLISKACRGHCAEERSKHSIEINQNNIKVLSLYSHTSRLGKVSVSAGKDTNRPEN